MRKPLLALLYPLLLVLACASPDAKPQAAAELRVGVEPPRLYVNEVLGVRVAMPEGWVVHSEPTTAPPGIADYLMQRTGSTAGTQMVGFAADGSAFVMLTAEPNAITLRERFDAMLAAADDRFITRDAWVSDERESARWIFSASQGAAEFTYFDTLTLREGHAIRVSFWTLTPLFGIRRAEFERISGLVEFQDGSEWVSRWEGLAASFDLTPVQDVARTPLETAAASARIACPDPDRHLLWRVEGSSGVVHLFGSIHIGREDFYPLAPVVEDAFAGSNHLVVEVDMTNPETLEQSQRFVERGRLPEDRMLVDEIGPEMYGTLEDAFAELGLTLEQFDRMAPWTLALTLSMLKLQSLGYLPAFGVEAYLTGQVGNRSILELESAEQQFSLFESLDGTAFLAYTLDSLDTVESQSREMMEAWMCGDDLALSELLLDSLDPEMPGAEEFYEKVFYDRNRSMADGIEALLEKPGRYFVLVGAGHLVGDRSIVSHLRQRGYTVKRR